MNTKTQHTPGEWVTSRDGVPEWHVQITVYSESTGARVATVFDREANAPLIAAAPELLEALEKALESLRNVPLVGGVYDQQHSDTQLAADQIAKAAIAKAKGQA